MAVAVDAVGTGDNDTGTTLDYTGITVGGSASALVFLVTWGGNPGAITSVTWDFGGTAQAMTQIGTTQSDPTWTTRFVALFGLVNPTAGNNTLRIVQANSVATKRAAISFTGSSTAGGAGTFANFATSSGTGATLDLTVTSNASAYIVAAVAADSSTVSFNSGTQIFTTAGDGWGGAAAYRAGGAPTQVIQAAISGSPSTRMSGCSIMPQPTAAVTGTATATITEADVVAGGKTIIVTLADETFVAATVGPNIQHVGSRVNSFAGTTSAQTVTLGSLTGGDTGDTTPQAGDLVIVTYAIGSTVARTPTIATPGGGAAYTNANAVLTQSDNFDASMLVAYKFMGGTPDTQVTLSETGGGTGNIADAGAYTIQVFRGVDSSTPLDVAVVTGGAANSSAVDPGQITPSTAGAIVVAMGAAASGTGSTMTSSDLTDFVATSRADTNDISIGAGYSTWAAGALNPAAFGNIPAGTTANSWVSLTIALRPLVTTPFADARAAIITGIDSAQAEAAGWDAKVKANIPVGNVVRTSDTVCTVTLQAQADYDITAQETITVTLPASALTGDAQIVATPTFTVDTSGGAPADPEGRLLGGKLLRGGLLRSGVLH